MDSPPHILKTLCTILPETASEEKGEIHLLGFLPGIGGVLSSAAGEQFQRTQNARFYGRADERFLPSLTVKQEMFTVIGEPVAATCRPSDRSQFH